MERWKKGLFVVAGAQMMVTAAAQTSTPLLPFFLAELGVTEPRAVRRWAGMLAGVNALFTGMFSPVWGSLSDRYGKKPMLLRSAASIAVFTFLTGCAGNVQHVLLLRVLQGAFSGFSAAALSLLGALVPREHFAFAVGLLQAGQIMGLLLGPLLGGVLADFFPYRLVFRLGSLLALAALLVILVCVKEETSGGETRARGGGLKLRGFFRHAGLKAAFTVIFLTQFAVRGVEPLIPLFVFELVGKVPALNTLVGLAMALQGVSSALGAALTGRVAARVGHRKFLLLNLVMAATLYFPQAATGNIWAFMGLRAVQGFFLGGLLPATNSLIGAMTPLEIRGSVYGLTSSAFFFGNFLGPLVTSFLSAHLGLRAVFLVAAGILYLNLIWIWGNIKERGGAEAGQEES
ncbi:MFS transporter [Desulfovirgula thermocuniculi]|uniref:MFS transporter n=1 Tax=Desulfovirgula thermocuniculi TaxID=348842 RepID=UPI0004218C9F|nr:MFS transporter [Desulfovirgula thermocuniculi]